MISIRIILVPVTLTGVIGGEGEPPSDPVPTVPVPGAADQEPSASGASIPLRAPDWRVD